VLLTQALPAADVPEQHAVASVGDDVVDHDGWHYEALGFAVDAQRVSP
jgi:hypothetical protein